MAPHTESTAIAGPTAQSAPTEAMISRTLALAGDVFQDDAKVLEWLRSRHSVFGVPPLLMMSTREGLRAVEENLEALSHGIV
jgi:uncharacterized protein (DUF2384 family)